MPPPAGASWTPVFATTCGLIGSLPWAVIVHFGGSWSQATDLPQDRSLGTLPALATYNMRLIILPLGPGLKKDPQKPRI